MKYFVPKTVWINGKKVKVRVPKGMEIPERFSSPKKAFGEIE